MSLKVYIFDAGIVTAALHLIDLMLFWFVKKEERAQRRIAKRNAYVRKYIMGGQDDDAQSE